MRQLAKADVPSHQYEATVQSTRNDKEHTQTPFDGQDSPIMETGQGCHGREAIEV